VKLTPAHALIIVLVVIAVLVMVMLGVLQWSPLHNGPEKGIPLTIGVQTGVQGAPFYIAEEEGFFSRNGLNVTLLDYSTGLDTKNALLNGDVDLSTPSEFVIVGTVLNSNKNISGIAVFDRFTGMSIIGRKDHGIANVSDLSGKRIGLTLGTAEEFYLGRFLELNQMDIHDVDLVNVNVLQSVNDIENGSVDAIINQHPYNDEVQVNLGSNAVTWPAQSGQNIFEVVTGNDDWIAGHPDEIKRVLTSLNQADQYMETNPAEAQAIVQKKLGYTSSYIDTVWPDNQFSLSLDQSLISAMEDESRWEIANNMTNATVVPDFRNCIYTKGLDEVKPDAVNIVGMT
jgi:NitT/TauT family transport system substrate-binding protein